MVSTPRSILKVMAAALTAAALAGGCEGSKVVGEYPDYDRPGEDKYKKPDSIFGDGGVGFGFGGDSTGPSDGGIGGGVGVNSFLWRASLDTVSFMPVNSADPFGGVIITDWYAFPEAPSERFKLNIYILGRALRADGVRVAVFRQVDDGTGAWRDSPLPEETGTGIEDAILTKARQLRFEVLQR